MFIDSFSPLSVNKPFLFEPIASLSSYDAPKFIGAARFQFNSGWSIQRTASVFETVIIMLLAAESGLKLFSVQKYIHLVHRFWIIQSARADYHVPGMRQHMRANSISTSGKTDRHSYFL